MPTVKVYGLTPLTEPGRRMRLCSELAEAVSNIEELQLKPENVKIRLIREFDADGREIEVVVDDLFEHPRDKPPRTAEIRRRLAMSLAEAVDRIFPNRIVEVKVFSLHQGDDGYWRS